MHMTTMVKLDAGKWGDPPVTRIGGMHIPVTVVPKMLAGTITTMSLTMDLAILYIQQTVKMTSDWFSCRIASRMMVIDCMRV